MKFGLSFRLGSLWIGAHWSPFNKRLCVNFVPCVTLWITFAGGNTPDDSRRLNKLMEIAYTNDQLRYAAWRIAQEQQKKRHLEP